MRINGFHHLALQVHDVERVAAFYRDVLGLTELARYPRPEGGLRSIWVGLPESGFLAIERFEGASPGSERPLAAGVSLVALRIPREERATWVAELGKRGIAIEHQTRWTVYFRDPEGNRVALSHHPADPL